MLPCRSSMTCCLEESNTQAKISVVRPRLSLTVQEVDPLSLFSMLLPHCERQGLLDGQRDQILNKVAREGRKQYHELIDSN